MAENVWTPPKSFVNNKKCQLNWLFIQKGPPGEPSLKLRVDNEPFGRMEELAVLRAGQTVSLRCTSKGGNPVPSLTFTKNGVSFGPGPKAYQNMHTFVATPEDNGAVFGCIAQNQVDSADSKTVRLNVLCKYKNAWLKYKSVKVFFLIFTLPHFLHPPPKTSNSLFFKKKLNLIDIIWTWPATIIGMSQSLGHSNITGKEIVFSKNRT